MSRDLSPLKIAFPDYDVTTLPPIPAGLVDSSWRNDSCPCFALQAGGESYLQLFVDYIDPADREEPASARFAVYMSHVAGTVLAYAGDDFTAAVDCASAALYCHLLSRDIGPDNLAEVRRRNTHEPAYRRATGACAAHDFCDANMVALEAFEAVHGREADMDDRADGSEAPDILAINRLTEAAAGMLQESR